MEDPRPKPHAPEDLSLPPRSVSPPTLSIPNACLPPGVLPSLPASLSTPSLLSSLPANHIKKEMKLTQQQQQQQQQQQENGGLVKSSERTYTHLDLEEGEHALFFSFVNEKRLFVAL